MPDAVLALLIVLGAAVIGMTLGGVAFLILVGTLYPDCTCRMCRWLDGPAHMTRGTPSPAGFPVPEEPG